MSRETILVRIDSDGVHSEFVGGSEYSDGDFLANGASLGRSMSRECKRTYPTVRYEDLGERSTVPSSPSPHSLYAMHGRAGRTGRSDEGVGEPCGVESL